MSSTTSHRSPPQQPPQTTFLHRLQTSSNSTQLIGFLTLATVAAILLLLIGLTLTAAVVTLIFFSPIILITSPFWLPFVVLVLVPVLGFLSLAAFIAASFAALSWFYRYFKGLHPPGSDRFDYARNRLANTAREVKDYARDYGGYLHSKVKDAAPGA